MAELARELRHTLKPSWKEYLMEIYGTGFVSDNSVWFGASPLHVESKDGENLRFTVPENLPSGNYSVQVENAHGKSEPVEVFICAAGTPSLLGRIPPVPETSC
jgi:TIG domain